MLLTTTDCIKLDEAAVLCILSHGVSFVLLIGVGIIRYSRLQHHVVLISDMNGQIGQMIVSQKKSIVLDHSAAMRH